MCSLTACLLINREFRPYSDGRVKLPGSFIDWCIRIIRSQNVASLCGNLWASMPSAGGLYVLL